MSKYHLRKLTFHNPYLGTVEDYFSYTSSDSEWRNVDAVRRWAANTDGGHIAKKVDSTPQFCLTVDVIVSGLNEVEAKAAKITAIALSEMVGHDIVNKR